MCVCIYICILYICSLYVCIYVFSLSLSLPLCSKWDSQGRMQENAFRSLEFNLFGIASPLILPIFCLFVSLECDDTCKHIWKIQAPSEGYVQKYWWCVAQPSSTALHSSYRFMLLILLNKWGLGTLMSLTKIPQLNWK